MPAGVFGKNLHVKNGKDEHHHWILHVQISLASKFHFKRTILNFGTKFAPKKVFPIKNRKSVHQWFLHIVISLDTKFQLKLTILNFGTKFARKGHFCSKTEQVTMNMTGPPSNIWMFCITTQQNTKAILFP